MCSRCFHTGIFRCISKSARQPRSGSDWMLVVGNTSNNRVAFDSLSLLFFLWTHGPDYLLIIHDFSMTTFRAIWWAVSVAGKKKINKNSWRRKRRKITYTLAIFVRFFLFFVFHRWKGKWPPMRCGERNKNRLRCFLIIQQRLMAPYTSYYTWCARWGAQRIKMSQT